MLAIALSFLLPAADLTVARLTGLGAEVAEIALGQPDIARREAHGALWTYRKADCVLFVYLADKGEGLKVTGLGSGPRRAGDQAPTTEACLTATAAVANPAPQAQDAAVPTGTSP